MKKNYKYKYSIYYKTTNGVLVKNYYEDVRKGVADLTIGEEKDMRCYSVQAYEYGSDGHYKTYESYAKNKKGEWIKIV